MSASRPSLQVLAPAASDEEAAAIVAAIERFVRATAVPAGRQATPRDGWRRAAIVEGIERDPGGDLPEPWINT